MHVTIKVFMELFHIYGRHILYDELNYYRFYCSALHRVRRDEPFYSLAGCQTFLLRCAANTTDVFQQIIRA